MTGYKPEKPPLPLPGAAKALDWLMDKAKRIGPWDFEAAKKTSVWVSRNPRQCRFINSENLWVNVEVSANEVRAGGVVPITIKVQVNMPLRKKCALVMPNSRRLVEPLVCGGRQLGHDEVDESGLMQLPNGYTLE